MYQQHQQHGGYGVGRAPELFHDCMDADLRLARQGHGALWQATPTQQAAPQYGGRPPLTNGASGQRHTDLSFSEQSQQYQHAAHSSSLQYAAPDAVTTPRFSAAPQTPQQARGALSRGVPDGLPQQYNSFQGSAASSAVRGPELDAFVQQHLAKVRAYYQRRIHELEGALVDAQRAAVAATSTGGGGMQPAMMVHRSVSPIQMRDASMFHGAPPQQYQQPLGSLNFAGQGQFGGGAATTNPYGLAMLSWPQLHNPQPAALAAVGAGGGSLIAQVRGELGLPQQGAYRSEHFERSYGAAAANYSGMVGTGTPPRGRSPPTPPRQQYLPLDGRATPRGSMLY